MTLAFLGWNRTCEYSADRAGLAGCAKAGEGHFSPGQLLPGHRRTHNWSWRRLIAKSGR